MTTPDDRTFVRQTIRAYEDSTRRHAEAFERLDPAVQLPLTGSVGPTRWMAAISPARR
jgi:uncharacterized protein (DUF2252 family)